MAATVGGWLGFAEVVALKDFALAGDLLKHNTLCQKCQDYFELLQKEYDNENGNFQLISDSLMGESEAF